MAPNRYSWVTGWFLFTGPMMIWDAGYCLMRPRSMAGGDLYWLWKPYEYYSQFDHVYGPKAFQEGDGFSNAAAILNLLESLASLTYLLLVYLFPTEFAPLVGYTGASMTLAKTILYVMQEHFCGFCATGHNSLSNIFLFFVMPNFVWLAFSFAVMFRLGRDLTLPLREGKSVKSIIKD